MCFCFLVLFSFFAFSFFFFVVVVWFCLLCLFVLFCVCVLCWRCVGPRVLAMDPATCRSGTCQVSSTWTGCSGLRHHSIATYPSGMCQASPIWAVCSWVQHRPSRRFAGPLGFVQRQAKPSCLWSRLDQYLGQCARHQGPSHVVIVRTPAATSVSTSVQSTETVF